MIRAIRSDHNSFKEVRFDKGLNIVLAERTKESTDKDSRNRLGKTTLIEIIHFCLGSTIKPNKGLRVKDLEDWTFILDLTLKGKDYTVYRNTSDLYEITIDGDFSDWPIKPEYDISKNAFIFNIKNWNLLLGYLMFDLPLISPVKKYVPTFRSLISYFMRRGIGAFHDPFRSHPQQKEWEIQVYNAYLLGLNWEYAAEIQMKKDKEKTLQELKKAAEQGLLTGFMGSLGELEAERVQLEVEIKRLEREFKTFKVHPQYYDIQKESNELTQAIHEVTNEYILNQHILDKYEESIIEEEDISINKVKQIYSEAGFIFPVNVVKKFNDVVEFHKKIIKNRKAYLETEISRIAREIDYQKAQIEELSNKRAELLEILNTHGALEEYSKLQNKAALLREELQEVKRRKDNLQKFEEGKSSLRIEKEELYQKTFRDFYERRVQVDSAIELFNSNSKALYSESGRLYINVTETGYKYNVDIRGTTSQGIGYMKIFCYDLTLIQLRAKYGLMPDFLIHDSTIFDGVDERQVAKALELAADEAEQKGFQYICALNSDIIPYNDFSQNFRSKFDKYVKIILTDATRDGGLLGFRF